MGIDFWIAYKTTAKSSRTEDMFWMFACVSDPRIVNSRLTSSDVTQIPGPGIDFVGEFTKPGVIEKLVWGMVGTHLVDKRRHQSLGFTENVGELLQAQFAQALLGLSYQTRLSEIPEVPSDAIKRKTNVEPMCSGHRPKPLWKRRKILGKGPIAAVRVRLNPRGQYALNLL